MRICFLTHTLNPRTGIGNLSSKTIEGIKKERLESDFTILTGEDKLEPNILKLIWNWKHIRQAVRNADIIHALDAYPYGIVATFANRGINKPFILTAVGTGSLQMIGQRSVRGILARWCYRRASCITAISSYVAEEVKKHLPDIDIITITPGIDWEFFEQRSATKMDDVLVALRPYVLTVGEMKARKGYEQALAAIASLFPQRAVNYAIVSNQRRNRNYWQKIESLVENLGVSERVKILSDLSMEDLRAVYQQAECYLLLPQKVNGDIEGYGMSVMEAAAAGTPSVVGRGSGAVDAVRDGISGFLVDGNNKTEISKKLRSILDNPSRRWELSQGAMALARENSWESKVKQYIRAYEDLLSLRK